MQRLEVSGIPVLWAEGPEPVTAAVTFRTGQADEPLHLRGTGHLLEHLVSDLSGVPDDVYNAFIGLLVTEFHMRGTQEQADAFLREVLERLPVPPLDRLEHERTVLRHEADGREPSLLAREFSLRFGYRSFGVIDGEELGLRWVGPAELDAWGRERFTAGNAVIRVLGPRPPRDLPALPPGERLPPPPEVPLPRLELPAFAPGSTSGAGVAMVADESDALTLALTLAALELHDDLRGRRALCYGVGWSAHPLSARRHHVDLLSDCRDENAPEVADALLACLERLAEEGPPAAELARARAGWIEKEREGQDDVALRLAYASRLLVLGGEAPDTFEELRDQIEAITQEDVAAAMRPALDSAIVMTSEGVPRPRRRLKDHAIAIEPPPVAGETFRPRGLLGRGPRLTVGAAGITYADGGDVTTFPADELAAAVREPRGWLTLHRLDGMVYTLRPDGWRDGDRALAAVEALVGEERIVPAEDGPVEHLERLAAEHLKKGPAKEAARLLPPVLFPGERPLALGSATRRLTSGILAVTDRRVLFVGGSKVVDIPLEQVTIAMSDDLQGAKQRLTVGNAHPRWGPEIVFLVTPARRAAELARAIGAARAAAAPRD